MRAGGSIVLNADDPGVMARHNYPSFASPSRRIVLFSLDSSRPEIQDHVAGGGSACVLHGEWLELRGPEGARRVVRASLVPGTFGGTATFQIENALAALAACTSLGVPPEIIASGLMASGNSADDHADGNAFLLNHGVLVVDYARNADAVAAVAQMLRRWPAIRRAAVLGLPQGLSRTP